MSFANKAAIAVCWATSALLAGIIVNSFAQVPAQPKSQAAPQPQVAAQATPETKAAVVAAPMPVVPAAQAQPAPAPAPLKRGPPEHIQAACMSKVQGLIPNGTTVTDMSVVFHHSLDRNTGMYQYVSVFDFYTVTVEAETWGRRFRSRYTCRQIGDTFDILRN